MSFVQRIFGFLGSIALSYAHRAYPLTPGVWLLWLHKQNACCAANKTQTVRLRVTCIRVKPRRTQAYPPQNSPHASMCLCCEHYWTYNAHSLAQPSVCQWTELIKKLANENFTQICTEDSFLLYTHKVLAH